MNVICKWLLSGIYTGISYKHFEVDDFQLPQIETLERIFWKVSPLLTSTGTSP